MIDSGVRQGFIMSPWLFNVYMDPMMKEVKMGMGRMEVKLVRLMEEGVTDVGGIWPDI